MLRSEAVARVAEGLGFRPDLDAIIVQRLIEAQRNMEQGKSLPRFLLQEDHHLLVAAGTVSIPLPVGFIREFDYEPLRYVVPPESSSGRPTSLRRRVLRDAFDAYGFVPDISTIGTPSPPRIYVLRNNTIDLFPTPDRDYEFVWSWYKADAVLTSDIENQWLRHASDWLIGEAGHRLAMSLRDAEALSIFDTMKNMGRAAVFGDDIAREFSGRAYVLGAAN